MNDEIVAALLGSLANPTRLAILRHLVKAGPDGDAAGAIASAISATPSRASFHLSAMVDIGILSVQRQSRSMIYRVEFAALANVLAYFIEDCCAGDAALRACFAKPKTC